MIIVIFFEILVTVSITPLSLPWTIVITRGSVSHPTQKNCVLLVRRKNMFLPLWKNTNQNPTIKQDQAGFGFVFATLVLAFIGSQ